MYHCRFSRNLDSVGSWGCVVLVGVGIAAKERRTTAGRDGLVAQHVLGQISVAVGVGVVVVFAVAE